MRRILVAHHLLLGDTLMLTPLLAKLRARHPDADIAMTVPTAIAPLYATRPYGVRALAWSPREPSVALFAEAPFDVAYVPGENRYAWLAAAMRARWIVAFAGERVHGARAGPSTSSAPIAWTPGAWGTSPEPADGPPPAHYRTTWTWPAPPCRAFVQPPGAYAAAARSAPARR